MDKVKVNLQKHFRRPNFFHIHCYTPWVQLIKRTAIMISFHCFYSHHFTLYILVQFALVLSTSPNMAAPYLESSMQHHTTLLHALSSYKIIDIS